MRNLQEQIKKPFCYQKLFWPFTVWINCSSDLKNFANSRPSASNFKSFCRSLEQFLLTEVRTILIIKYHGSKLLQLSQCYTFHSNLEIIWMSYHSTNEQIWNNCYYSPSIYYDQLFSLLQNYFKKCNTRISNSWVVNICSVLSMMEKNHILFLKIKVENLCR